MTNKSIQAITSHQSDDWFTPKYLLDNIQYDFDPCPYMHDVALWDGLKVDWDGVVFCNPPYSQTALWVEKALIELKYRPHLRVKFLIPSRTDTKYFHSLMESGFVSKIVFFKGRIGFSDTKSGVFPSVLIELSHDESPISVLTCDSKKISFVL